MRPTFPVAFGVLFVASRMHCDTHEEGLFNAAISLSDFFDGLSKSYVLLVWALVVCLQLSRLPV